MTKNAQTTTQLHSSHTLLSNGQNSPSQASTVHELWISKMFKLDLEKAEEPEIKLPTSAGSLKKQESFRKTSIFSLLTMQKPLTVWFISICGKFFMRREYQATWPASWEICMQVKWVPQGCILSLCLFNLYADYIMWNARPNEAQAGIKIAGRNINNLRYADDTTLMAERE